MDSRRGGLLRQTAPLPGFVLVGAAKSGTTTLYEYLRRHPGVAMCEPKEPEFFSRDDVYARGEGWYRSLFAHCRPDQIAGEASTTYTRWPHTPDAASRLARLLPEAKLVYVMRDPVRRAYSHYAHHMREGATMSFEDALERSSIYVDCGLYLMQIERYLRYFPRESFLFLLLRDLVEEREETLERVQRFLDLPPRPLGGRPVVANRRADEHVRRRTTGALRAIPGISPLADRLPRRVRSGFFRLVRNSPLGRRIGRTFRLPPMRPETRRALAERFRDPNRRLGEFLGRDLSHWQA